MKRRHSDVFVAKPKPGLKRTKTLVLAAPAARKKRQALKVELKYVDVSATAAGLNTTGVVQCINLSAEGDDNTNRDGRQTQNVSVAIRGLIRPEDNTTPAPTLVRVMIVWDRQPNGVLAPLNQILQNATALSFNNLDNKRRFKIIRDYQFALGGMDTTATSSFAQSPTVHSLNDYITLPADMDSYWNTNTGVIGSLNTGALLLVQVGTGAAGAGGTFEGFTRVRWNG